MQAYLVRVGRTHEVVGLFVSDSLATLGELVDECTDVSGCEYLPVGVGGLFVPSKTDAQLPARQVDEDFHPDDEHPFDGAVLSELWYDALRHNERWKTLSPARD